MCAITGVWNLNNALVDREVVQRFTASLKHRGPDGEGIYLNGNLALGHRLLAITSDSSQAHQPMPYQNRYWITFNGEIYNYLDLRQELSSLGHTFQTSTDTEVALAAYAQWGADCQFRFNGMWAFAIWDSHNSSLFLSRDRFGIKPLFYYKDREKFVFASELKAFLSLSNFDFDFDSQFIADSLASQASSEGVEHTFVKGVRRLKAGHHLYLQQNKNIEIKRWWSTLDHVKAPLSSFDEQVEHFREIFTDACRIAAPKSCPFGTTLSGGLDSTSVLFTLSQLFPKTDSSSTYTRFALHSYFPEGDFDERHFAEEGAAAAGATYSLNCIEDKAAIDSLEKMIFDLEDLKGCPSARWLTYRALRRSGIKVSLEGEGADELLAGYPHYPLFAMQSALFPFPNWRRIRELNQTSRALENKPKASFRLAQEACRALLFSKLGDAYLSARSKLEGFPSLSRWWDKAHHRLRPGSQVRSWLKLAPQPFSFESFSQDRQKWRGLNHLDKQLYWDFHYGLLPGILRSVDRCSMAHGLEVRSPFLDWRLVCFSFSLPSESRLGGHTSKRILRAAMMGRVPERIRNRSDKVPFQTPLLRWLRGPFREYLLSHLSSVKFLQSEVWSGREIRRDVESAFRSQNYAAVLPSWSFLQTYRLMELFTREARQ